MINIDKAAHTIADIDTISPIPGMIVYGGYTSMYHEDMLYSVRKLGGDFVILVKARDPYKAIEKAIGITEQTPTEVLRRRRHGEWREEVTCKMKLIYEDDTKTDVELISEVRCSACKLWSTKFKYHIQYRYCPHCGAKMA